MSISKLVYKQYFTPTEIAKLMVDNIPNKKFYRIVDLAVGDGELLREVIKKFKHTSLYGADIDQNVINKLKENKSIENATLWVGDSLSSDICSWSEYDDVVKSEKFCLCVGNPPFNFFNRGADGTSNGDKLAIEIRFIMRYIEITKDNGYIAIIVPNGILCNEKYGNIRSFMLSKCYIECVINLYDNSFKEVNADISIIIMQKKVSCEVQDKVKLKSVNTSFQEEVIHIEATDAIERMDFEHYSKRQSIMQALEEIPYKKVLLSEVVGFCKRGISITKQKHCISDTGYMFIHTTDIDNVIIKANEKKYIDYKYLDKFINSKANVGDVLVGRVGTKCIRKVGVVTQHFEDSIISDCIFILRDLKINPYYLSLFLKTKIGQEQLDYIKRGSCSKFITKEDLMNIIIPIIPEELQKGFEMDIKKLHNKYYLMLDYNIIEKALNEQIQILEQLMRWNYETGPINICASTN